MPAGDLATWVTALLAAVGVVGAWRAYRVSRDMRADEQERDRRRQATAVSAWVTAIINDDKQIGAAVVVDNGSESAIYDVDLRTVLDERDAPVVRAKIIPPGRMYAEYRHWHRENQGRTYAWSLLTDTNQCEFELRPYTVTAKYGVSALTFMDGSGLRWRRSATGALEPIDSPYP